MQLTEMQRLEGAIQLYELELFAAKEELYRLKQEGAQAFAGVEVKQETPVQTSDTPEDRNCGIVWDRELMAAFIGAMPGRVELALLKLESFQTASEKYTGGTMHKNGRGFSKKHNTKQTKQMLVWIKSWKNRVIDGKRYGFSHLTNQGGPWALDAYCIAMSYCKQLAEIANEEGSVAWLNVSGYRV